MGETNKIKMELWLTPQEKKELFNYSETIICYDEYKRGKIKKSNASLAVRLIMNFLLNGTIDLPKNEYPQKVIFREARRYRPIVDKDQRDKFLVFCADKGYAPNQAILWVVRNKNINKYL